VKETALLQILEFGPYCLFARTHPYETTRFSSLEPGGDFHGLVEAEMTLGRLADLRRLLAGRRWDLIACHVPIRPLRPWSLRALAYRRLLRSAGASLIGLDFNDGKALTPTALAVLARARLYFKRELPLDEAALLPAGTPEQRALLARHRHKLRPLSLGLAPWRIADLPATPPAKRADLFFAGTVRRDDPLRGDGVARLRRLAGEGVAVDLAEQRLERAPYLARMAGAWLTWSPAGRGWQCFRHFEALAVGSVPLVNRPDIAMADPLLPGEHCLVYDPEGDDLSRAVRAALADKPRLARIAAAGRELVLRHHLHRPVAEGIVAAALP
jgi:hypothetical protein